MKSFHYVLPILFLGVVSPALADDKKPAKEEVFQIPYRLTATQHVLVRAKINGKGPFNFILDTGAPALFVSTAIGKKLELTADKAGWATLDRFTLEGGAAVPKAKARIEDPFQLEGMNGLGLADAHLDGIIGYNILARFRIEFDFTKDKMAFTPLKFDPPPPHGFGGGAAAAGGLDTMAALMKFVGGWLGKKAEPEIILPGFFGLELAENKDGVQVKSVLGKGPAEKAGIEAGDQITEIQGNKVRLVADFRREASKIPAGGNARLTVTRGDKTKEVKVPLAKGF
jgi:membrane-associated protease RseP (regulator of RpoE activity)